ncbi:MAG: DNA recombination protein RmuC, partial [Casimicrobium sp.]
GRFQERMDKLATHIRQASDDVQDVQISSRKITSGFERIKAVEIESDAELTTNANPSPLRGEG